ncbi:hypothetical protein OS493_034802 [Desmophyllum pertusum]|uniref:Uncharacterized protein n=1 Tax=Desmophyllum pertusum TaxID=174260 RepID=A0A9W9YK36_9CNID|nr:hypothetical protein OS493_034802 [Desmophyllum pertusum]
MAMLIFLLGVGLAFIAAVSSEAFIEAQDPSMKGETNVKHSHNGCSADTSLLDCSSDQVCVNGKCQKKECDDHNPCKQGFYCDSWASWECHVIPAGFCTSASSCSASHCCLKYHSLQTLGLCGKLKQPNEFCILKNSDSPAGYHCGCMDGYECKEYQNNEYDPWGTCQQEEPGSGLEE